LAYTAQGSVYYRVDHWPEFGKLSHLPRSEMLAVANERGNNPDDPAKRDPLDFVLWQAQKPGEPAWDSPWGAGRPGWHIECSSMAARFLGPTIDLHSGGSDLLFPHHECEIAQSEPVTGQKPFVRHWLHTAMVQLDGEKMSKSLGNLVMVSDLLQEISADTIRYYLAGYHYRDTWDYDKAQWPRAAAAVDALCAAVSAADGSQPPALDAAPAVRAFAAAMDNDLDTATALSALQELARSIREAAAEGRAIAAAQNQLRRMAGIFGLRLTDNEPEARVIEGWNHHAQRFA
jgi:L-cysteine:1D-myo-inositol 2-amino-2-deoxy-alpha-D-glucopyranoside ligase